MKAFLDSTGAKQNGLHVQRAGVGCGRRRPAFGAAARSTSSPLSSLCCAGGLWQAGALVGKPAAVFVSVGTQGGGMETTALTFITQLAHHGMIYVPTGYSFGEGRPRCLLLLLLLFGLLSGAALLPLLRRMCSPHAG